MSSSDNSGKLEASITVPMTVTVTVEGICKHRLELLGARTRTLEFPRVILLRKLSFWAPESADSGKSADPESEL